MTAAPNVQGDQMPAQAFGSYVTLGVTGTPDDPAGASPGCASSPNAQVCVGADHRRMPMTTLDDVVDLARPEQFLMTVATLRTDGTIQASLVNAGVMDHPVAG